MLFWIRIDSPCSNGDPVQRNNYFVNRSQAVIKPITTGEQPRGLSVLKQVKAILLDVYGTMLVSRAGESGFSVGHGYGKSIQHLLGKFEIPDSPEKVTRLVQAAITKKHDDLRAQGIDFPEVDILEIWQGILGWDDRLRLKTFAWEYESTINPVYPMPGLRALLGSCRERGLTMGIISNAQFYTRDLLEAMLAKPLDAWGFDLQLIFYSYQYQTAKPSVRLFNMAADRLLELGIQPESSLYVGNDMRNDVLPAKSAGFQAALFAGDQRSLRWRKDDPNCRDLVPDVVVTDLRQLIPGRAGLEGCRFGG